MSYEYQLKSKQRNGFTQNWYEFDLAMVDWLIVEVD